MDNLADSTEALETSDGLRRCRVEVVSLRLRVLGGGGELRITGLCADVELW